LKGKLLGEIDKAEVDHFADIWDKSLQELETMEEVDGFFRTYLKAHFTEKRKQGQDLFDGPYHREIFDASSNSLKLLHNPHNIKSFLRGPFRYYAGLYLKLCRLGQDEHSAIPGMLLQLATEPDGWPYHADACSMFSGRSR